MCLLKFSALLFICAFKVLCMSHCCESTKISKISVMVSLIESFAFYEKQILKGLDIDIIKNVAKKFQLEVEYIVINGTLSAIFDTSSTADTFCHSINES